VGNLTFNLSATPVAEEPVLPTAPLNPSAVAGNAQATVTWSAPSSLGTGTLTGYAVKSGGQTRCTTTSTSCTATGLTNGQSYAFTVTATTTAGTGPASVESNAVVPSAGVGSVASPPRDVVAVPDDGYAIVRWSAPVSWGSGSFVKYVARASDSAHSCESTTESVRTCEVTGLANNTSYTFTVVAVTSEGASLASEPSSAVTPNPYASNSAAPSIVGTVRYGSTVSVDKGVWDGGVTSFAYVWKRDGVAISGATGTKYKLTKADVGKKLKVMVRGSGPQRLANYITSAARTGAKAVPTFSESSANRAKRVEGVAAGQPITLTFSLGTTANGGKVTARLLDKVRGSATVESGKARIKISTTGVSKGKRTLKLSYGGTKYANAVAKSYTLTIR